MAIQFRGAGAQDAAKAPVNIFRSAPIRPPQGQSVLDMIASGQITPESIDSNLMQQIVGQAEAAMNGGQFAGAGQQMRNTYAPITGGQNVQAPQIAPATGFPQQRPANRMQNRARVLPNSTVQFPQQATKPTTPTVSTPGFTPPASPGAGGYQGGRATSLADAFRARQQGFQGRAASFG